MAEGTQADVTSPEAEDALLSPEQWRRSRRFLFGEMLVFATLSLIASFVLSYDAILLAADPGADLACSINPFLDCAKVGLTWQAKVFGFPNAFLGMISEPVVMTIAVAALAGTRFPRWFMFTANAVYLLGVIFAYWLLFQSTFVINALCPWCILITLSTTFVFVSMTHWNILENNLYLSPAAHKKAVAFARGGWITIAVVAWLAIIVVIEGFRWGPMIF